MTTTPNTPRDMTLAQAFELYRTRRGHRDAPRSPATIKKTEYVLTKYAHEFWSRPLDSITRLKCAALFAQLTNVGPVVANKTMSCLRAVINVGHDEQYRRGGLDGNFEFINPVTRMLRNTPLNPVRIRNGHIPTERTRAVWQALKQLGERADRPGTRTAADWLRFRLMTGTRVADSRALRFTDIDPENDFITIPATATKSGRALVLPMSPQMCELIAHRRAEQMARHPGEEMAADAFIFESDSSFSGHIMSARATLKAVAGDEITEHDIRRTFMVVARECGVDRDVLDRLLNRPDPVHRWMFCNYPQGLLNALTRIAEWLDHRDGSSVSPSRVGAPSQPIDGGRWMH